MRRNRDPLDQLRIYGEVGITTDPTSPPKEGPRLWMEMRCYSWHGASSARRHVPNTNPSVQLLYDHHPGAVATDHQKNASPVDYSETYLTVEEARRLAEDILVWCDWADEQA